MFDSQETCGGCVIAWFPFVSWRSYYGAPFTNITRLAVRSSSSVITTPAYTFLIFILIFTIFPAVWRFFGPPAFFFATLEEKKKRKEERGKGKEKRRKWEDLSIFP